MTTVAEDISSVLDTLRANGVEKMVDGDMVAALLELYSTDNQRIDLVLLELEGMLGLTFRVGTQLQRYQFYHLLFAVF